MLTTRCSTHSIEHRANQKEQADRAQSRKERPTEQASMQDAERGPIDPARDGREIGVPALREPIPGKARHDPTRHHRDQHDHGGESETPPEPRRYGYAVGLQVHQQIGDAEDGHRRDQRQVTPIPPGDDLPRNEREQNHRKGQIRCDG